MYCKYCGTYVEGESDVCPNCKSKENLNNNALIDNTPTYTEQEKYNDRRAGLGGAIASCVMGFVGYIIAIMACIFSVTIPGIGILFIITCITLGVISLVKGIASVQLFKANCKLKKSKPIATLVVGIHGICFAGITFFVCLYAFIFLIAGLSML